MELTTEECKIILELLNGYADKLMCKDKLYAEKSFKIVGRMVKYIVENETINNKGE